MTPDEFHRRFMSEPHTDLIKERDRDREIRKAAEDEFMLTFRWSSRDGAFRDARILSVEGRWDGRDLVRWYAVDSIRMVEMNNPEGRLWSILEKMQREMLRTVFPEEVA